MPRPTSEPSDEARAAVILFTKQRLPGAYSGRDGAVLWDLLPGYTGGNSFPYFADSLADLGVQPGSPYPVFALNEPGFLTSGWDGRLLRVRASLPGGGVQLGSGCATSGNVPLLGYRSAGTGLGLTVAKTFPGALGVLVVGSSTTTYHGTPLPYSLDPYGLSGCSLLVGPEITTFRMLGTSGLDAGYARVDFPGVPVAAGGREWFAQWLVLAPGAAGLDFAASRAQRVVLQ